MAKVDGWGSLLGDAGSGFAIGRAGLDAVLRAADGRAESTGLLAAAERRFAPVPQLAEAVYGAPVPTRAIAAFAGDVAREAAAGDVVARRILNEAAQELALSAVTALERLFAPGEEAAVSYAGNVFLAGAPLLEPFERAVGERRPGARVVPPQGDSLAGAALLAGRSQDLRPQPGLLWNAP
jgi:N-acetylglucosamine kinase-like BadF-type ATPase